MSLFRPALAPLLRSPPLVRSYAEALSAPSSTSAPPAGFRKPKLFDEFQYDETTSTGHQLIQKERDALAFMRTVELELPKLTPIPFEVPNVEEEYLRFHTQKSWPLERDSKESSVVTLSAPVSCLPLTSPAAKHKFLLLTTPEYYHPFRPTSFNRLPAFKAQHASQPLPKSRRHGNTPVPRHIHESSHVSRTGRPAILGKEQAPRVGGYTPREAIEMESDQGYTRGLNDRLGEDADGWFVVRCDMFRYQLQNKKWCEDTLRRIVREANNDSDGFSDIPLDSTHFTKQFMLEKRRPDGTKVSLKDFPAEWNVFKKDDGGNSSA